MKNVLVINEKDLNDGEVSTVGVVTSVEEANRLILEYYGPHEVVYKRVIQDSSLECERKIKLWCGLGVRYYEVFIWTEWFTLNKA